MPRATNNIRWFISEFLLAYNAFNSLCTRPISCNSYCQCPSLAALMSHTWINSDIAKFRSSRVWIKYYFENKDVRLCGGAYSKWNKTTLLNIVLCEFYGNWKSLKLWSRYVYTRIIVLKAIAFWNCAFVRSILFLFLCAIVGVTLGLNKLYRKFMQQRKSQCGNH